MATPTPRYFAETGDLFIDGMTHGYFWSLDSSKAVDYSISKGFQAEYWYYPADMATYFGAVLGTVSVYANISFNYVGNYVTPSSAALGGSDITLSLSQTGGGLFTSDYQWGSAFFPDASENTTWYQGAPGDIFINASSAAVNLPSYAPGSQGWFLFLHEALHALGLKHPHDGGGTGRPTFSELGISWLNQDWATVMSYEDDAQWSSFFWDPATPMILDVIALQYLYGKNLAHNLGNTVYTLTDTNSYYTLWDAGGVDTLDASGERKGWAVALPNTTISNLVDTKVGFAAPLDGWVGSAPTTLVWLAGDYENITGTAFADDLSGNDFNNILIGGSGNDTIFGGSGNDTLTGGLGRDEFLFDKNSNGNDVITDLEIGDVISIAEANFSNPVTSGNGQYVGLNQAQAQVISGNTILKIGTDAFFGSDVDITIRGVFYASQFSVLNNTEILVIAYCNSAPVGSVDISGAAKVGQVLSVSHSLVDADGLGTVRYQWRANGSSINGATDSSYALTSADLGKSITVAANYTDQLGNVESVVSVATALVTSADLPIETVLAASYTTPISAIDSIGLSPDGEYFLIKVAGVTQSVLVGSSIAFNGRIVSTEYLATQIVAQPAFRSSGGSKGYTLPELFTGPASLNLDYQLIESADNAVVIGGATNDFIKVSSASSLGKAVDGGAGDDVIDGGVGSTFISGGTGSNTIFLDGRASGVSWSTVTDFKLGQDKATIWGWKKGVSKVSTVFTDFNSGGAPNYTGLTLHFENLLPDDAALGQTNSNFNSITLSNRTLADFGATSLMDLNTQIAANTNSHFQVGVVSDAFGDHGYLFIS